MPISSNLGGNVSSSKEDPGLTKVVVGPDRDVCPASVLVLDECGKVGLGVMARDFGVKT